MAFGRKKITAPEFNQSNVSTLASAALAAKRATLVRLALRLTGETPLLMHRWGQKSMMEMLGKMVGQPQPRVAKDLTAEFEESYYRNERGQVVVPCRIIKAATIDGAISTGGVTSKAELKRGLRVLGYTTPVHMNGREMQMDCRVAKNGETPDVRSRAVVPAGYHLDVVFQFGTTSLTPDKVMAAIEGAGEQIGICDWRPEKGGDYGTFSVSVLPDKEIDRILKDCSSPEVEYDIPPEFLRAFTGSAAPQTDTARKAVAVLKKVNGDARKSRGADA